jgi:LPS export ABC transporter protein LptC
LAGRKRLKAFFLATSALALASVLVLFWVSVRSRGDRPAFKETFPEASIAIEEVRYTHTNKNAFKEWELNASSAQYFKDEDVVHLTDIRVAFFAEGGKVYRLTAQRGELSPSSNNIWVHGGVTGKTSDGYEFETGQLRYHAASRKMSTEDKVALSSGKLAFEGRGMVVDLETEKLFLLKEVKALGIQ